MPAAALIFSQWMGILMLIPSFNHESRLAGMGCSPHAGGRVQDAVDSFAQRLDGARFI